MKEKTTFQKIVNRYFILGLNGMALGLFCTLIVGLILKQVGGLLTGSIGTFITMIGSLATFCTGAAIGVGTAYVMEMPRMVIFSSVVTGFIGANAAAAAAGTLLQEGGSVLLSGPGDPLGAFLAVLVGGEMGRLVSGKTKVDIIVTPAVTILTGGIAGVLLGPPLSAGMLWLGNAINVATQLQPFFMGIVISVVMGIALTLPISSAALSIILGLSGLPAGAATVGCSAQMIGFAVSSFRENKWDGLFAQGIGTSMLQISNIVKHPAIWIPPTLTAAILGPLSTMVFRMENIPAGGGMGTSGLVGQIMTWQTMVADRSPVLLLIQILLLHFILPAVLSFLISEWMRKHGYIHLGDMKLDLS